MAEPVVRTYDPAAPETSCPDRGVCDDWLTFRTANPWPYQTTAIAMHGDQAVVVLSEPPPTVSRNELAAAVSQLFGDDLLQASYLRWPTGADGWLEDLVVRVRIKDPAPREVVGQDLKSRQAPASLVERLRVLQYAQFSTSDGAWFDEIRPRTPPAAVREVQASVAELRAWLGTPEERWSSLSDPAQGRTLAQISADGKAGAFRQAGGQLVLLVVPKGQDPRLASAFRRFAVESDLLLGATSARNGALILVGRTRRLPMDVLPPLRFETYAAFAAAPDAELAQSYERRRMFAGKVRDGRFKDWDWAPILLSPQLQDGEMGTLLNVADQILKSWSQHGDVAYYGFVYPKPKTYPFGELAASDYFTGRFQTTSLRFNWNTKDFATILEAPERSYLTVDRTGALPILYEPTGSLLQLLMGVGGNTDDRLLVNRMREREGEAQTDAVGKALLARDHFVDGGDPVLARVVQNVILFQAVQGFGSAWGKPVVPTSRSERVAAQLQIEAQRWIGNLARNDWAEVDAEGRAAVRAYMTRSGTTTQLLAQAIANPQAAEDGLLRRQNTLRQSAKGIPALNERAESLNADYRRLFDANCARLNGSQANGRCNYSVSDRQKSAVQASWSPVERKGDEAQAAVTAVNTAIEKLMGDRATLERDVRNFNEALAVGEILAEQSHDAALDGILERVLVAGRTIPNPGSIRTPSVVLSKNKIDVEAVGGHSLTLKPGRAKIATDGSPPRMTPGADAPTLIVPPQRVAEVESLLRSASDGATPAPPAAPRPVQVALGDPPPQGSMLEAMTRAQVPESQLTRTVDLLHGCNCDAVIRQAPDGSLTLARRGPPVVRLGLYGKDAVIEQLASPPSPKLVMFEGLSPESVSHIGRSVTEAQAANAGRKGFLSGISDLARGPRPTDPQVTLLTRVGNRFELFRVWGDHAPLRRAVDWKTSQAEAASGETWSGAFAGEQLGSGDQAIFLRLGPGPSADLVGVRARGATTQGGQGLLTTARTWLAKRTTPTPVDESLVSLRAELRKALPSEVELDFFYRNNARTIRAADVGADTPVLAGGS